MEKIEYAARKDVDAAEALEHFAELAEKRNKAYYVLKKIDYLSHSEAIQRQQSSQILLLLINNSENAKGILTGKFYEYLAAHRPILAVGPTDGDASKVLLSTGAGKIVDFNNEIKTKEVVLEYYKLYKSAELKTVASSVEQYSRRSLTGELAELLNTL